MDTTAKKKPKTMAEMLPMLSGLLSPSTSRYMLSTVKKNPRSTRTSENYKPKSIAEMCLRFSAYEPKTPKKHVQMSALKKWNSSTKIVHKTVSHTLNEHREHHSVRKVLNFQPPQPKVEKSFLNSRAAMMNAETPKLPKPEVGAKKPLYQLARKNVRISGICNIPETPVVINKTVKSRMSIANKENFLNPPVVTRTTVVQQSTPKSTLRKKVLASMIPDTPLSNESRKSSADDSFLQNERDIDIENQVKPLTDEKTLESIGEESPPESTTSTEYTNVGDYLNNTHNHIENTYHDNNIMSLDNMVCKDNSKRKESIIVSLSEMLNKATVTSYEQSTKLEDFLKVQKQIENTLEIVNIRIESMMTDKEAQLKSLACIKKLIHNKTEREKVSLKKKNMPYESTPKNDNKVTTMTSSSCSLKNVNQKQLAYKIPKKTLQGVCKKKVIHENRSRPMLPQKPMGDRALSMYLQMKERNNFLTTPLVKRQPPPSMAQSTTALISLNLQQQLERLYEEN